MLVATWMVVAVAVLLSERSGPGWAIGVLMTGGVLLVLALGAGMPRARRPVLLARPAAVDIEARRIEAFQERINETAIEEREDRGT